MSGFRHRKSAAFTILEIIVVAGLVALLAAGTGIALLHGRGTVRMRAAEETLMGYLQEARLRAIVDRRRVRILIFDGTHDRDRHWRSLQMVARVRSGESDWEAVTEERLLPAGVYLWPPWSAPSLSWVERANTGGAVAAGWNGPAHFLEIAANGEFARPGSLFLVSARWLPDREHPELTEDVLSRGLLVSRMGGMVAIDEENGYR